MKVFVLLGILVSKNFLTVSIDTQIGVYKDKKTCIEQLRGFEKNVDKEKYRNVRFICKKAPVLGE